MKIIHTDLPGVLVLTPQRHEDARGWFMESFNAKQFAQAVGQEVTFVQDNHAYSKQNVLRGIHYQRVAPQGKLVRVVSGCVLDVAVDLRRSSSTFGRSVCVELSADNQKQLWIPPGFGHGYWVRSLDAEVLYKTTTYWQPEYECSVRWDDPVLNINWILGTQVPLLSDKDQNAPSLEHASVYE